MEVFSHCDYFIILSRDKENIIIQSEILFEDIIRNEYYFNNKHKSPKLIASFESILDKNSKDIIYEEDGILLGKVTNLQRDKMPDSLKIKALANKLIKEIIIR